jgi:hypothetical protein
MYALQRVCEVKIIQFWIICDFDHLLYYIEPGGGAVSTDLGNV